MFFKKKVDDGTRPLEYKRGKRTKKEYVSKCLGYRFRIPEGVVLENEEQLVEKSKANDICDLWAKNSLGGVVQVGFVPQDGYMMLQDGITKIDDTLIDYIASEGAKRINEQSTDGRKSTYYGIREFAGKKCTHSIIELNRNGVTFFTEIYTHSTLFYQIMFVFNYTYENQIGVNELKEAFLPL